MTVTEENDPHLTRAQNRFLRRIYNGRSVPIIVDGRPFVTYKQAIQYLRSLTPAEREAAYAQMKDQAKSPRRAPEE